MITKEQALQLHYRQEIYHLTERNADGTPQRWRVNGKAETWKTMPDRFKIPLKHGLRDFWYLDEDNADQFTILEREAVYTGMIAKLHPRRFIDWETTSAKMYYIISVIVDQDWVTSDSGGERHFYINSDGVVFDNYSDMQFSSWSNIGSVEDFYRNINGYIDNAKLNKPERELFRELRERRITDFRK